MKKDKWFSFRISETDRAALDELTRFYNLSASAVVCMLIAREIRLIEKQGKENEK